jgi:isoamylase
VNFTLASPGSGKQWYRVTDTCNWADGPDTVALPGIEILIGGQGANYNLCGQALLLLIAK